MMYVERMILETVREMDLSPSGTFEIVVEAGAFVRVPITKLPGSVEVGTTSNFGIAKFVDYV